jgi:hypothetical protein
VSDRNDFLETEVTRNAEIRVYCDDLSTRTGVHRSRAVEVARLLPVASGWIAVTANRFANEERRRAGGNLDAALASERVLKDGSVVPGTEGGDYDHLKLVLVCELCGLDFQRALTAEVAAVLDRLQHERITSISLHALAATLA